MQFRKAILLLSVIILFGFLSLQCAQLLASSGNLGRAQAWMNIHHYAESCREAEELIQSDPNSKQAWVVYTQALAKMGEEKKLLEARKLCSAHLPQELRNRELLELIAWGIIENGVKSSIQQVRLYSYLGAYLGQDAKSIPLLKKGLRDASPHIRAITSKLIADYRDRPLQDEVLFLLNEEKHPFVREELIRTAGKMKIYSAEESLIAILSKDVFSAEEKAAAIEALLNLVESTKRRDIQQLISSERAGLRELACRVISYTLDSENADLLFPLFFDCNAEVRKSAIQALGLLGLETKKFETLLQDPDPYVSISAAWALTLYDSFCGLTAFEKWLVHPNKELQRFAAGALAGTGKHGISLMKRVLKESLDPFVQVNVAIGLIAQRESTLEACLALSQFLEKIDERIMWVNQGSLRYLSTSNIKFHPIIPGFPESKNLFTHLELLNLLAILEDPKAFLLTKNFLKNNDLGVMGLAASIFLTEADESFSRVVANLLTDADPIIRIQSALILALWGGEENTITVLQEAYHESDRETKEHILEAMGQVESENAIPFLVTALEESSQTLRILAAASLLKCLYR